MWDFFTQVLTGGTSLISWILEQIGLKKTEAENFKSNVNSAMSGDDITLQMRDEFKRQDEELKNGSSTTEIETGTGSSIGAEDSKG